MASNNEFYFYSSLEAKVTHVEVCNKCHRFFTGKQQVVTTAGRVDSFNSKFNNFRNKTIKDVELNKSATIVTPKVKKTRKDQPKISKNKSSTTEN